MTTPPQFELPKLEDYPKPKYLIVKNLSDVELAQINNPVTDTCWQEVDGKGSVADSLLLEPTPTHPGYTQGDELYNEPDEKTPFDEAISNQTEEHVAGEKEFDVFKDTETPYNYIKPSHYDILPGVDVCTIAEAVGLDQDAYMFMVLKYVLRHGKPNEPRYRDVQKIREYADIWLRKNHPNKEY